MSGDEDDVIVLDQAVIGSPEQGDEADDREENEVNAADEERNEVVERDLIMVVEDEAAEQNDDCDGSPARKKGKMAEDDDDDDGFLCLICYCPFTNSGEHRISCLACGHIFGKSCIMKWLKSAKSCPQCNDVARKKDIRVLYTKHLKALDTTERDRALHDLDIAKQGKQQAELEIAKLRLLHQANLEEIKKLKDRITRYEIQVQELEKALQDSTASSSSQAKAAIDRARSFANSGSGDLSSKSDGVFFSPLKTFNWVGQECRVGAFSEWSNAFVVSQKIQKHATSGLFKGLGNYGVRILNWADTKKLTNIPIHQKEIRDMMFSPSQTDLLLTVGMDNKAFLTNIHTTTQAVSFSTDSPIWSCAFNCVDPNKLYLGMGNGQIAVYDLRKPKEVVENYLFPNDRTPVGRIQFIPPSYQHSGFSACGLLVQKLMTCWFIEFRGEGEISYHQLPVDGGFLGIDFEPVSRHLLVSSRTNPSRHMVCEMTHHNYDENSGGRVFGCNVIKTYSGGSQIGKIYRPKIFSPSAGKVYIAATKSSSEVEIWDLAESNMKQTFRTNNVVLDYIPVKHNDDYYINFLHSDGLDVYKY